MRPWHHRQVRRHECQELGALDAVAPGVGLVGRVAPPPATLSALLKWGFRVGGAASRTQLRLVVGGCAVAGSSCMRRRRGRVRGCDVLAPRIIILLSAAHYCLVLSRSESRYGRTITSERPLDRRAGRSALRRRLTPRPPNPTAAQAKETPGEAPPDRTISHAWVALAASIETLQEAGLGGRGPRAGRRLTRREFVGCGGGCGRDERATPSRALSEPGPVAGSAQLRARPSCGLGPVAGSACGLVRPWGCRLGSRRRTV